ncbi:MAG: tRNA (adenosine(37)-N6)-dimethylallyltransferase MiaA [Clostridia bacterium]|nr:tRNA (adenosine(37)-N6)-dimethylallyltransferase MiaA [Clostridia bacterium]
MEEMKPKVVVIVGPTASGKTAVSIELAKKINGEIVSADSMQIYKYMDIGTAKPSMEEQNGIKHYMLDVASPNEQFNVARYKELATNAIEEILKKNKTPIIVGGTGLYINTLVNGIEFIDTNHDEEYIRELQERCEKEGVDSLFNELQRIDPDAAQIIDKNNVRRVIRALEIYKVTGKTKTQIDKESIQEVKYDYQMFGIEWEREELYNRINQRVDLMLENGLIDEVKNLIQKYQLSNTAIQGLGYKEVIDYLNGNLSYEAMVEKLKIETRHYAKRQLTWFRRDERIKWVKKEEAVNLIINTLECK